MLHPYAKNQEKKKKGNKIDQSSLVAGWSGRTNWSREDISMERSDWSAHAHRWRCCDRRSGCVYSPHPRTSQSSSSPSSGEAIHLLVTIYEREAPLQISTMFAF